MFFKIIIIKPLFNQVKPIEIKNLFFEGDLDKAGNNVWNANKKSWKKLLIFNAKKAHRNQDLKGNLIHASISQFCFLNSMNQPDRIRQFGRCRRGAHRALEPSATGDGETSSRGFPNNVKMGVRDGETPLPPPELPHVAFQSPLLEYSAALGIGGGGLSPNRHPAAPSFSRATDTPRYPLNFTFTYAVILTMSFGDNLSKRTALPVTVTIKALCANLNAECEWQTSPTTMAHPKNCVS